MAMLRGIAELRGAALTTNVRDDAAEQLAAVLAEPSATAGALAACSRAAQVAWAALAAAGGRMKTPIFARMHGMIRPIGPGKLERELTWQQPGTPAEELWYRGLIFKAFADFGDGPAEYIYIPDELRLGADLPPGAAQQAEIGLPTPVRAPQRIQQAYHTLAVDTCALLAALRETPARLDSTGRLSSGDMTRLQEGLVIGHPLRCDLAISLARSRGWLATDRGRLVLNTQAASAWLRQTLWEQMSALFIAWRNAIDWNDLLRIPALQAEGTWRNDPVATRHAILDFLRRLEEDTWYHLDDLVAWVKAALPDFQRPDGNYTAWYLRDVATGRYLSGFDAWDEVEGRLIRFVVSGPLFWLGGVALDPADDGQPRAFRLTQFGSAWLKERMPLDLPRPGPLSVDEKFNIVAPLTLPFLDRFRLLRLAEPIAETYELGQPTHHRITRGSLARARASGLNADAIVQFLRRASGGRVPPRVVAGLERWEQHGGAVRISRGALLRVGDASILAALRADPVIAPLLGDLVSAQAVLISDANLPKLLKAMDELGYTIKVE